MEGLNASQASPLHTPPPPLLQKHRPTTSSTQRNTKLERQASKMPKQRLPKTNYTVTITTRTVLFNSSACMFPWQLSDLECNECDQQRGSSCLLFCISPPLPPPPQLYFICSSSSRGQSRGVGGGGGGRLRK